MTRHLSVVPDWTPPPGTWLLDLGPHDGTHCPTCHASDGIPTAVGVHDGNVRLCTACTATGNPPLAAALEAVDSLDAALADTATDSDCAHLAVLIAHAVTHVIDTATAQDPT